MPLHRYELVNMSNSMLAIEQTCFERLNTIKGEFFLTSITWPAPTDLLLFFLSPTHYDGRLAVCKIQNLDTKDHLKRFAFGLVRMVLMCNNDLFLTIRSFLQFYYLDNIDEVLTSTYYKSEYFGQVDHQYHESSDDDDDAEVDVDQVLNKGPQHDQVDLSTYDTPAEVLSLLQPTPTLSPLWNVHWRGWYETQYDSYRCSIGHLNMTIPQEDGTFSGSGSESLGCFQVFGKRVGSQVVFTKAYSDQNGGARWTYEGAINDDQDEMSGTYCYGRAVEETTSFPVISPADVLGTFSIRRRPLYYFLCRPFKSQFDDNKPRALWKFALDAVLHATRSQARRVSWDYLKDRRDRRRKYVELYMQFDELRGEGQNIKLLRPMTQEDCAKFAEFEISVTTADLLFYRSLARCLMRREVIHL